MRERETHCRPALQALNCSRWSQAARNRRQRGNRRASPPHCCRDGRAEKSRVFPQRSVHAAAREKFVAPRGRSSRPAQRVRGGPIGCPARAAEPEDRSGRENSGLSSILKRLGHDQRRMVRQHHAAGGRTRIRLVTAAILPNHEIGRRARHRGEIMMLGQPS